MQKYNRLQTRLLLLLRLSPHAQFYQGNQRCKSHAVSERGDRPAQVQRSPRLDQPPADIPLPFLSALAYDSVPDQEFL